MTQELFELTGLSLTAYYAVANRSRFMCGITATLCVILGRFYLLPDPLNSLQGRTPEQTDPLWSALARWLLTSSDKNRKHTSGHGKPQWGCLIGC